MNDRIDKLIQRLEGKSHYSEKNAEILESVFKDC